MASARKRGEQVTDTRSIITTSTAPSIAPTRATVRAIRHGRLTVAVPIRSFWRMKEVDPQVRVHVPRDRLVHGFLQDNEVAGTDDESFPRVAEGPVHIHPDRQLAPSLSLAQDGYQAGRREAQSSLY